MLQTQGLRPLDPFGTLHLHPRAPRELVAEVYWALVSRTNRRDIQSPATRQRLDEMNSAYALLMDDARRARYLKECGIDERAAREPAGDRYELLCLHESADAQIIEIAYKVLSRRDARAVRQAERDEAHRTLANPQLRAQYDVARRAARSTNGTPLPAPRLVDVRDLQSRDAGEPRKRRLFGIGRGQPAERPPDPIDERLRSLRGEAVRSLDDIAAGLADEPDDEPAFAEIVFTAGPRAGEHVHLRDGATALADTSLPDPLGTSAGSVFATLWRHGDNFMLREAAGGALTIAGHPLALPVVMLEDGDEIRTGDHRMRFRLLLDS